MSETFRNGSNEFALDATQARDFRVDATSGMGLDRLSPSTARDNAGLASLHPGANPFAVSPLQSEFATSGPVKIGHHGHMAADFDGSYHLAIDSGHWVATNGVDTTDLTGTTTVVIGGTTYEMVDHFGAGVGGFQSVQAAIDAAPNSGGATILIAPGTYHESAVPTEASATAGGLYINKPDLTLQGVKADGSYITSAAELQVGMATA